jgi:hypothetical protein
MLRTEAIGSVAGFRAGSNAWSCERGRSVLGLGGGMGWSSVRRGDIPVAPSPFILALTWSRIRVLLVAMARGILAKGLLGAASVKIPENAKPAHTIGTARRAARRTTLDHKVY